jgi:hypothetical protein
VRRVNWVGGDLIDGVACGLREIAVLRQLKLVNMQDDSVAELKDTVEVSSGSAPREADGLAPRISRERATERDWETRAEEGCYLLSCSFASITLHMYRQCAPSTPPFRLLFQEAVRPQVQPVANTMVGWSMLQTPILLRFPCRTQMKLAKMKRTRI